MKTSFFKHCLTVLTCGLLALGAGHAYADQQKLPSGTPYDQIGQKIEDYYKEHEKTSAGLATSVFDKDGQTIYQNNFGYVDKEKKLAVDDNSVFEWGSATKLTVWVSVMQLWEEGKIDLKTDIKEYLPKDFLKGKLTYDKPITMLDLMNHQAGFGDTGLAKGTSKNLGDTLKKVHIYQAYEPGTVTAYSNFGTALAGYIVERISRQSYADYVHEHIFEPLDMRHTALLPDLSDNPYVVEKRKEVKGYTRDGRLIGEAPYLIEMYPAGRATGTLEDFKAFAQALLQKKTLFKRSETWDTLYTATSNYPDSDLPTNAHGFWSDLYQDQVILGHGGNTAGFSSSLTLDLKSGIAAVILTNQLGEKNYVEKIPELVYGQKKDVPNKKKEELKPGFYRDASQFFGPLSIARLNMATFYIDKNSENRFYWSLEKVGKREFIKRPVSDYFKLSNWEVAKEFGSVILWGLAIFYALLSLVSALLVKLYRLLAKRTNRKPMTLAWSLWHYLTCGLVLSTVLITILIVQYNMNISGSPNNSAWLYVIFAITGLLLLASSVLPILLRSKFQVSKGRKILTYLTSSASLIVVLNILYWGLYQWWAL
ncbi:beta-lactamase family protein [Streptococcus sanguinis]|uniref:serine hydrolase domain-containing protein n=1 Tax=Streptococcus sanguinis TaxID=1305 RepID=UPI001CC189B9|nr:serine hydrolase domain-containing protein [Streptococcus sanguinis]MBZ2065580.1 beta-lactamase family protein [Streptococcus sanguinis]